MWCKFGRHDGGRYNEYTCCFCCHVRMGTVFLGVFNLIRDLLALTMLAALSLHPELTSDQSSMIASYLGLRNNVSDEMSDTFNTTTPPLSPLPPSVWNTDDKLLGMLLTVGSVLLTIGLLYGTITARPKYILPYFWLQMFDFCITSLTVIGYFSYGPDTERWLIQHEMFPYRDELLSLGRGWLLVLSALTAVLILWIKAYCISVVWSCYKFLIYRLSSQHGALTSISGVPVSVVDTSGVIITRDRIGETEMILPPKYEDLSPYDPSQPDVMSSVAPPPAYEAVITVVTSGVTPGGAEAPITRNN